MKIWGIDFGIDHPFGAVLTAWDRDADVIHVLHAIRITGGIPAIHASPMKAVAADAPVAYPHDGAARDKGSGEALAKIYKNEGLRMLDHHATLVEGGYATEPGIMEMLQRMRTGRLKVAAHLADWFGEFRNYHREDGLIVKLNDNLMSANRIAVMARRHARNGPLGNRRSSYRGVAQIAEGVDFDLFWMSGCETSRYTMVALGHRT